MTATRVARRWSTLAYLLASVVGAAAFLYPFWLPADAAIGTAHAADAPFIAGAVGGLALLAVLLDVRAGSMSGADVALLGMLGAMAGLLRLVDLPGGGSGIFFLVLLGAAAFGPRFGFLLGLFSMAVSALLTGGVGPWLPFQMLVLAWLAAGFGVLGRTTRRLAAGADRSPASRRHRATSPHDGDVLARSPRPAARLHGPAVEVAVLAAAGWLAAFAYGLLINLWSWPLTPGEGDLQWSPGMGAIDAAQHYWSFYVSTSLVWDAAGATANLVAIVVLGRPVLRSLRRFAARLDPVVELEAAEVTPVGAGGGGPAPVPATAAP
jgi:energy-coupling factor transport system substrate-specific component